MKSSVKRLKMRSNGAKNKSQFMLPERKLNASKQNIGNTACCITACIILLLMPEAQAANDFYEAFDYKKCLHYSIDNEPHGIDLSKESKDYIRAFERAKQDPNSWFRPWQEIDQLPASKANKLVSVYSANVKGKNKIAFSQFGACYGHPSIGVTCLPGQDFPLSGASYKLVASKGALKTLACTKACDVTPDFIYDMGYENMEGERNMEHEAALKKFRQLCGSGVL